MLRHVIWVAVAVLLVAALPVQADHSDITYRGCEGCERLVVPGPHDPWAVYRDVQEVRQNAEEGDPSVDHAETTDHAAACGRDVDTSDWTLRMGDDGGLVFSGDPHQASTANCASGTQPPVDWSQPGGSGDAGVDLGIPSADVACTDAARPGCTDVRSRGTGLRVDAASTSGAVRQMPDGAVLEDRLDAWWSVAVLVSAIVAPFVAWRLYRRISDDGLLDNDVRRAIVETVRDRPSVNAARLAETVGVRLQTILYHVRVLEEGGWIRSVSTGRETQFFPRDGMDRAEVRIRSVLARDGKGALLRLLLDEPGLHVAEAARRLDVHRSTVKRHADDLVEGGLVREVRDGSRRRLEVAPTVRDTVRDVRGA